MNTGRNPKSHKPDFACLRASSVAEMLDISTRTLYRKVSRGEFPGPLRIGQGTTRWRLRDVEAYLDQGRPR